jgi:large subunit ribosomal protein L25
MATVKEMKATVRSKSGKGAARAERRAGRVPGVIYGDSKPPVAIALDHAELRQRIYAGRFLTSIYDIEIDGKKHRVIPRDYQLDPVKDHPVHVDFLRLGEGQPIRVNIAVRVINAEASPGIKRGGAVNIVTHAIEISCLPEDIPESIDVDIAGLEINYSKHLRDVKLPANVKVLAPEEMTLVTIVPPSGYAEEQRAAADAAAAAAAPVAGAAAPAAGAAAPAAGAAAPAAGAAAPAAGAAPAKK